MNRAMRQQERSPMIQIPNDPISMIFVDLPIPNSRESYCHFFAPLEDIQL